MSYGSTQGNFLRFSAFSLLRSPRPWLRRMGPGFSLRGLAPTPGPQGLWAGAKAQALQPGPKGGSLGPGAEARPWRLKPGPMGWSQVLGLGDGMEK